MVMTVVVAIVVTLLFLRPQPMLAMPRQPQKVVPLVSAYAIFSIAGMLPFYLGSPVRSPFIS